MECRLWPRQFHGRRFFAIIQFRAGLITLRPSREITAVFSTLSIARALIYCFQSNTPVANGSALRRRAKRDHINLALELLF